MGTATCRCPLGQKWWADYGRAEAPGSLGDLSGFFQSICAAVAFFYSNYLLLHWQLLVMVIFGFFGTISFFAVEWDAAAIVARGSDYRSI